MSAVSVSGLTRTFGDLVAVDDVSFEIDPGEVFGLLGANGAGKTTIVRILCCIYRPTSGRALVLGADTRERPDLIRARVGYMSQRFSLYGELTIEENLRFYTDVYGHAPSGSLDPVYEQVGLTAQHRATRADTLPTGIRQRAALAAAIAHEPELLFLDEPTSGVDPRSRKQFWELIHDLAAHGTTVLVTTHAMDEAQGCARIGMMAAGHMVAIGMPDELVEQTGLAIVAVDVTPWQQGYERIRSHWDDAALYGRQIHIPAADPNTVMRDAYALLRDLHVAAISIQRPTLEDAFIWHIARATR